MSVCQSVQAIQNTKVSQDTREHQVTEVGQDTKVSQDTQARQATEVGPGGGHLGIFWVGMCRPGFQIGTPF